MSTKPSRKRGGEKLTEDPRRKIPLIPVVDGCSAPYDVVLIVKGQRFYSNKKKLAEHSTYFEKMFFSEFAEKNKEEVDIGGLEPDVFQLFIDVVNGLFFMSDEFSEVALVAAIFLGSTTFEDKILKHLAGNSEITLQEQFKMAEDYNSNKLMVQVCASINDPYELDKVVPKDLDSICNTTKNLVMQRSFELLGIRKPQSPPLPEDPDQFFENMINQMIDQVETQNHHGEMLVNQAVLLFNHMGIEHYLSETDKPARDIMSRDPSIEELVNQLREAHSQEQKNFIHAQVQVLKLKHIYTRVQNPDVWLNPDLRVLIANSSQEKLRTLAAALNHNERSRSCSHNITLGNREIDEIYRRFITEIVERNPEERPMNINESAAWLDDINNMNERLANFQRNSQNRVRRPMPDGIRHVSNRANFRVINELISNFRFPHYLVPQSDNQENNEEVNEEGPDHNLNDQNPQEQEHN